MLFDSRTGQCIGPCAPAFATLPPAAPYAPLQYAPAHFASLPSSIPSEMPSKRKKPSSSASSSAHSSTSTNTLQRKLRKREKAKARTKVVPSSQPGAAAHETSNLMALLPSRLLRRRPAVLRTAWTADLRPGRPTSDRDRYRAKPGPSGADSRHPSGQDRSRSPQRARVILVPGPDDTGAPPGQIGMPNPPPPPAPSSWQPFHPHPGYQRPPPAPYGYGSWNVGMSSWQSIGGQQHGQAAHLLNHPPQPPSARHDRRQAQATWTDP